MSHAATLMHVQTQIDGLCLRADEMELRLEWAGSEPQHANQHRCRPPGQGQQQHPNHHHPPRHHHHQQQPAGHTGPRQHRSKGQPRPKAPEVPGGHPQPSPRRAPQVRQPVTSWAGMGGGHAKFLSMYSVLVLVPVGPRVLCSLLLMF